MEIGQRQVHIDNMGPVTFLNGEVLSETLGGRDRL